MNIKSMEIVDNYKIYKQYIEPIFIQKINFISKVISIFLHYIYRLNSDWLKIFIDEYVILLDFNE